MAFYFSFMIYDIHCHLDLYNEEEVDEVIKRARDNDVKVIITNSVDMKSCKKNLEYSKKYSDIVKLAVGFYPQDALSREEKEIWNKKEYDKFEDLREFVFANKKYVFAIGETGLDLKHGKDINSQIELLKKELELAEELNVPIILHSRKAENKILDVIRNYKCKKILHCFSGKFSLIKKAIEDGCYFSIPTNIVKLEHFQKMVREIPKDRILTETDAPFLSPYPGTKNEPSFIHETIKIIAEIWNMNEKETEKILWENFKSVFNQ